MGLPKELIDKAKKCDCKVCRTLVGSSWYNAEVLNPLDKWERKQAEQKNKQKATGKYVK